MKFLNEEVAKQLEEIFKGMKDDVTVALFTKEDDCETCEDTNDFISELLSVSSKLHLENHDIDKDSDKANEFGVLMAPSIVLLDKDKNYKRIKFNGVPSGHEINSFISSVMEVSGNSERLSDKIQARIEKINKPVNIKVFVTLACPHCAGAVQKAHKLALENTNIQADMIEAQTFFDMSEEYNVSSVPKIVINDEFEFVGNQPLEVFLDEIEKTQVA
ncbi:protein disulfide oxidoreductase [Gudongella sp. DL1XJH-153]|uniref:protein disulfide oxidoreductase n=1 Tax=Gudongella sp. DL1XJH-153 TaxID=3409804 RepID=UPI003BB72615